MKQVADHLAQMLPLTPEDREELLWELLALQVPEDAHPRDFMDKLSRHTKMKPVADLARELAKDNLKLMEETCAM